MIDYDKLKIATAICKQSGHSFSYFFGGGVIGDNWTIYDLDSGPLLHDGEDIDDLITKLRELTQPEPKYKVGDEVWVLVDNEPYETCVDSVCGLKYYLYKFTSGLVCESLIYPTKAELIRAQLEYWHNLRDTTPDNEPEYCNISGAKLGKREEYQPPFEGEVKGLYHPRNAADILIYGLCKSTQGTTGCQHESDGNNYDNQTKEIDNYKSVERVHLKCGKCGERYAYEECQHESDGFMYCGLETYNKPTATSIFHSNNCSKCIKCEEFYR